MINVPYAGHTNPTLPLAEMLVRRGHEVSYINSEEYRERIEKTGAQFVPYVHYPAAPTPQQKKTKCFRAAFDTAVGLDRKFDLLIYEMFFYPGKRIAELLSIPCVRQFSQQAWNQATMADATRFFRLSCFLIDAQIMGKLERRHMRLTNKTLAKAVLYDKPELNIVYVPRIFQGKSETFGCEYVFAVPIIESGAVSRKISYDQMKPPLIYVSLGSIISSRGFCKACIRAFGGKDMSVILNTGRIQPETLGKLADNIYAYSFVPQMEVLNHTSVFLTHCGMNSVNEAISRGVPMVCMPFINDQIANAKRIVALGIGKRVRSFPSRDKELYNAVKAVCGDAAMRSRSKEIQASLQNETSFEEVVSRIERLLV